MHVDGLFFSLFFSFLLSVFHFPSFVRAHAASVSPVRVYVECATPMRSPPCGGEPLFWPLQKSHSLPNSTFLPTPMSNPTAAVAAIPMLSNSLDTYVEILEFTNSRNSSPTNSQISSLIVAPPSTDAFFRAHRHSIPGHRLTNYLKFLHELAAQGSTFAHLFSTAVISGSSSAPNLQKEMPPRGENVGKSISSSDKIPNPESTNSEFILTKFAVCLISSKCNFVWESEYSFLLSKKTICNYLKIK